MEERYLRIQRLVDALLTRRGDISPLVRRAVEGRGAQLGGRSSREKIHIEEPIAAYVDKVALHAYRVTEEDIKELQRAGYSEDGIFEITLSAAVGAGMARLERGLEALKGS
jgi:hypothetical protein